MSNTTGPFFGKSTLIKQRDLITGRDIAENDEKKIDEKMEEEEDENILHTPVLNDD